MSLFLFSWLLCFYWFCVVLGFVGVFFVGCVEYRWWVGISCWWFWFLLIVFVIVVCLGGWWSCCDWGISGFGCVCWVFVVFGLVWGWGYRWWVFWCVWCCCWFRWFWVGWWCRVVGVLGLLVECLVVLGCWDVWVLVCVLEVYVIWCLVKFCGCCWSLWVVFWLVVFWWVVVYRRWGFVWWLVVFFLGVCWVDWWGVWSLFVFGDWGVGWLIGCVGWICFVCFLVGCWMVIWCCLDVSYVLVVFSVGWGGLVGCGGCFWVVIGGFILGCCVVFSWFGCVVVCFLGCGWMCFGGWLGWWLWLWLWWWLVVCWWLLCCVGDDCLWCV